MGNPYSVQRTVPRFSILAIAELGEAGSTACIVGKMSEISRKGCYVNTPRTLPMDTLLNVVISREGATFMTSGRVIYVHEAVGMGIVFLEPNEDQVKILDSWLANASRIEAV